MHHLRSFAIAVVLLTIGACRESPAGSAARTYEEARLAFRQGELARAQSLVDRALSIAAHLPDPTWTWKLRLLGGRILVDSRNFSAVTAIIAAAVPAGPDFDAVRAEQKYLEARAELARGRRAEARAALAAARAFTISSSDLQLDIDVLDGQVLLQLAQWMEGETTLQLAAAAAARAGDRFHEAVAFSNLGMGRLVRNRCDEALEWFERVLSFSDLEHLAVYTAAMSNAGACYARLGQFDKAAAVQQRAVRLYEQRGVSREYELAVGELGSTYLLQNDVDRAVPYLERALAIAKEAKLTGDASLWATNLAAAHIYADRWDAAERLNDEARLLNPPDRADKAVFNTLHSARIAAGRGQPALASRLFAEALTGAARDPAVRWGAYDGLAGLAVSSGDPHRAAEYFEAALEIIEQTRSDLLKTDYKLSFLTQLIQFYRAYVDTLVQRGAIGRALEIADSSRGRVLAERHGVTAPARVDARTFRQVAKHSNAVLLSYWLGRSRSYLWAVTADRIRLHDLPPASEIEALVRDHQSAIENALVDPLGAHDTAGDRLFRLLVAPVAGLIRDGRVVIVPDGALHRLNFETLPVDGTRRRYWIEDVAVQVAPSLAMLPTRPTPAAPAASVLLIGNPTPRAPDFPALRYAATEMSNIARHFERGRLLQFQGDRATPGAYREARPEQFDVVHFTAHAAANAASPLDSAVILAGPDHEFKLYARDVLEQALQAELVTVSACRSAGERTYSGEGLVGFAWAFLRAGARRVVAGLWDVDDQSTAELMDALYARLAAGAPAADALREAKLSLLRRPGKLAKPYYWAPFQLFTVSP